MAGGPCHQSRAKNRACPAWPQGLTPGPTDATPGHLSSGRTCHGGRIVILNGAPRSGKSSLAARCTRVPGRWIVFGVDAFNASLPPALLPASGSGRGRAARSRSDVRRLYAAISASSPSFRPKAMTWWPTSACTPIMPSPSIPRHDAGRFVACRSSGRDPLRSRDHPSPPEARTATGGMCPRRRKPGSVRRWQALHQGRCYDPRTRHGPTQRPRPGRRCWQSSCRAMACDTLSD